MSNIGKRELSDLVTHVWKLSACKQSLEIDDRGSVVRGDKRSKDGAVGHPNSERSGRRGGVRLEVVVEVTLIRKGWGDLEMKERPGGLRT